MSFTIRTPSTTVAPCRSTVSPCIEYDLKAGISMQFIRTTGVGDSTVLPAPFLASHPFAPVWLAAEALWPGSSGHHWQDVITSPSGVTYPLGIIERNLSAPSLGVSPLPRAARLPQRVPPHLRQLSRAETVAADARDEPSAELADVALAAFSQPVPAASHLAPVCWNRLRERVRAAWLPLRYSLPCVHGRRRHPGLVGR